MYGLDPDTSFEFLLDAALQQVCLGLHEVILNFDRSISISVESALAVTVGNESQRFDNLSAGAGALVALLDSTIVAASGASDGTLSIQFSNGTQFSIFDTSDQYESYQIKSVLGLIVV